MFNALVRSLLIAFLVCVHPTSLVSQQTDQAPGARITTDLRQTTVQRATGSIEIDGRVDEAAWLSATRVSAFVEQMPLEGGHPPADTEVLLAYDEENLYVAFIARDPNPADIRAGLQPRDQLWSDDWVGVVLDPHGDGSVGYYLISNPIGVQGDLLLTTRGEDSSLDFIFRTSGEITGDGYIVEMAIPFRSLRVPDRDIQEWGIMLVRNYPRSSRHVVTWPSMSRNNPCQICQLAKLEGLQEIRTGGNLEVLPSLVGSQAGGLGDSSDPASFENGRPRAQASLGVKYAFQRGGTVEATLNPDFSQVESDAAQVDVNTTFALFYPERRPFFQEGMDLYQTPFNVFHSRSINAPRAATKFTGRAGRTSIGYIGARDEHTPFIVPFAEGTSVLQGGRSFTNVLRLQHNLDGSHVGTLLTDRRLDGGGSGTTLGTDVRYRIGEMYTLTGHVVVSHTQEPDDPELSELLPELTFGDAGHTAAFDGESFHGHAGFLHFARDARTWSWNVLYLENSPTYRADTGFTAQNDLRRATGWTGITLDPRGRVVEQVRGSLFGGSYWNFQGVRTQDVFGPAVGVTLPRQTQVSLDASFQAETFGGVHLTGLRNYSLQVSTAPSSSLRGGFTMGTGRRVVRRAVAVPEVGSGDDASLWAVIRPMRQLVFEPSISFERLRLLDGEEMYSGYIARGRFNYQHNRELNFRIVVQFDDFRDRLDVEPLLVYQLNPLSVFYVGSTHRARQFDEQGFVGTERQFFAKLQYLFRR